MITDRFRRLPATGGNPVAFCFVLFLAAFPVGCGGSSLKSAQIEYEEGQEAFIRGNTEAALRHFQTSLQISEKKKSREGVVSSLHSIAMAHIRREEWREALGYLERTLELDRKNLNAAKSVKIPEKQKAAGVRLYETRVATTLNNLGRLHQRLGESHASLRRYGEVLVIELRMGRELGVAITHNNIGRILFALDKLDDARRHYLLALTLFKNLNDELRERAVRKNLGALDRLYRLRRLSPPRL